MKRFALLAILVAACGGKQPAPATPEPVPAPVAEPAPAAEPPLPDANALADHALAQAALAEQYELGKKIYAEKKCASCHGDRGEGNPKNPALIGEGSLPEAAPKKSKLRKGVTFKTAADVVAFVKAKMPIKAEGTLSDDEAAAVTAWILSENKVAIDKKLDATNAAAINLR